MFWTKIFEQVSKIQIHSITDSLFRNGLYILVLGTLAAIFHAENWICVTLFTLAGIFEIVGLVFYFYFAKVNPDYLRSESFQISKQSIEMLGDKTNKLNPNVKEIVAIANPHAQEVINGGDKLKSGNV